MASWFSNALSATSKGITSLKSTLLGSEGDGDTEDDTHVCRVLRGYYTEKGRPFPPWLPPDPKATPAATTSQTSSSAGRYGGMNQSQASTASSGGIQSLWDSPASSQQQAPQSLRAGNPRRQPAPSPFNTDNRPNLQSQRSYGSGVTPPGSSSGSVSTADRLRQRFGKGGAGGARTTSPANQSAFTPPPQPSQPTSGGSYARGGGGDYEDRFAPGGMYDNSGGGGGRPRGGSGGRSGGDKPFVSANAPWVTDGPGFGGGGRPGLPSGPRRGLPSGPRMR